MTEIEDLAPEPRETGEVGNHEQLREIVYRICERHGVPHRAERAFSLDLGPRKEQL